MIVGKSQWLSFFLWDRAPRRTTDTWTVQARRGGESLGTIQWYAPWRRYVFFPCGGLFDSHCLRDIAVFIDDRMAERRR